MRNMYTLLTIIISMMMITIHAEDCTKNVNWKTPSERNQLAQIQNVTLAMCRGEFGPNFDFALQAYKANPQNDAPLLKMICAKNSPGERRNLRALTNVCGQYFGVQFNLLESCPNKSTDPNFALASLILKCPANSDVALATDSDSEDDVSAGGCAWAGLINVTVGDACNGTAINQMAYNMGKMAGDLTRKMFPTRQNSFFSLLKEEQKYISCGSDDEGEGHRCCMAPVVSAHEYCINWVSGDPAKECLPTLCKGATTGEKFTSQTECLDTFLDIEPKTTGYCRTVGLSDCEDLARKYPKTCSVPSV